MSFLFSGQESAVLSFCVHECERQKTTPVAVLDMLDAYEYAMQWIAAIPGQRIGVSGCNAIFNKVLPNRPRPGNAYRNGPAVFDQGVRAALAPEHIVRQMELLFDQEDWLGQPDRMTNLEFVHRFLEIHPYIDGNGRVAAILFNLLEGTMLTPQPLPEMSFV